MSLVDGRRPRRRARGVADRRRRASRCAASLVLSTPLDGDFADGIKGALSADVLLGGAVRARSRSRSARALGRRARSGRRSAARSRGRAARPARDPRPRRRATRARYKIAVTALLDSQDHAGRRDRRRRRSRAARGDQAARDALARRSAGSARSRSRSCSRCSGRGGSVRRSRELHRGAIAVSRGDLDHRIEIPGGDELTDLATAFNQMTSTLKDNQARLAARMREIVALHDAGRAVSSVIDLDSVSRKIVDAVARTFDVQLAALWLVDGDGRAGAARGRRPRARAAPTSRAALATDEALAAAEALRPIAEQRARRARAAAARARGRRSGARRRARATAGAPGPARRAAARAQGRASSACSRSPAPRTRASSPRPISNLLTTFADQAGAAVENALLYSRGPRRPARSSRRRSGCARPSSPRSTPSSARRSPICARRRPSSCSPSAWPASASWSPASPTRSTRRPPRSAARSTASASALARVARHGAELAARAPTRGRAPRSPTFLEALGARARRAAAADRPDRAQGRARARGRARRAGIADAHALAAELADLGATADDAERLVAAIGADHGRSRPRGGRGAHRSRLPAPHRVDGAPRGRVRSSASSVRSRATRTSISRRRASRPISTKGSRPRSSCLHHALRDIVVERRLRQRCRRSRCTSTSSTRCGRT